MGGKERREDREEAGVREGPRPSGTTARGSARRLGGRGGGEGVGDDSWAGRAGTWSGARAAPRVLPYRAREVGAPGGETPKGRARAQARGDPLSASPGGSSRYRRRSDLQATSPCARLEAPPAALALMLPPQPLPPASARSPSPPAVYSGELGPLSRALPPPRVHAHTSPRNELSLGSRQRTRSLKYWSWAISEKKNPKNPFI
ncbi:unnamed protein product [Rangifer tarandus platyrhynchus]|uniref:Uncharacterized protein n=1 Tax=Rangifer tarandus platyrhynchus TaxID=3082113 RepID=A0ABN8Z4P5_RANTA|nr:unnamed protein product [Rangifer tarandus platyrhynchus]